MTTACVQEESLFHAAIIVEQLGPDLESHERERVIFFTAEEQKEYLQLIENGNTNESERIARVTEWSSTCLSFDEIEGRLKNYYPKGQGQYRSKTNEELARHLDAHIAKINKHGTRNKDLLKC